MSSTPGPPRSERFLVFLVGAVQFVNILDFVMVMPLGPDFAPELHFPVAKLGLVGGAYTASAAVAGLIASTFLDRFDRRKALAVAMLGLVLGTLSGAFAWDLWSLLAARVLAGAFGGPATSLALSIIADAVPPERRGKAMGAVMGAFSAASVLGLPLGLELARIGSWRTPFYAVAGLGVVVAGIGLALMPPMRGHLAALASQPHRHGVARIIDTFAVMREPAALVAILCMGAATFSVFTIVPNLSAYVQHNLHYPRASLGILYLVGGVVSFFAMRLAGWAVDRTGASPVSTFGTAVFAATLVFGFITPIPGLPVVLLFVCFMVAGSMRGVPLQTLSSRVPAPHQRASFLSAQSAVQHLASAAGAVVSAQILVELPDDSLRNMPAVAAVSLAFAIMFPIMIWFVESRLRLRGTAVPASSGAAPPPSPPPAAPGR